MKYYIQLPVGDRHSEFIRDIHLDKRLRTKGENAWYRLLQAVGAKFWEDGCSISHKLHIDHWLNETGLHKNSGHLFVAILDLAKRHKRLTYKLADGYVEVEVPYIYEITGERGKRARQAQERTAGQIIENEIKPDQIKEEEKKHPFPTLEMDFDPDQDFLEREWWETLKHFGKEHDLFPNEQALIAARLSQYGVDQIRLAIIGARHEKPFDDFDPKDHLCLERILDPGKISKFANLGQKALLDEIRQQEKEEARKALAAPQAPLGSEYANLTEEEARAKIAQFTKFAKKIPCDTEGGVS